MNVDDFREKMKRDIDETKDPADRRRLEKDYLKRMERGWEASVKAARGEDSSDAE